MDAKQLEKWIADAESPFWECEHYPNFLEALSGFLSERGAADAQIGLRYGKPEESGVEVSLRARAGIHPLGAIADLIARKNGDRWSIFFEGGLKPSLSAEEIEFLVSDFHLSDYFDAVLELGADARTAVNLLKNDVSRHLNDSGSSMKSFSVEIGHFAELCALIKGAKVTNQALKTLLPEMLRASRSPSSLLEELGLSVVGDKGQIAEIVSAVIAENEKSVADYKAGKQNALQFLVGQVMKKTKGRADAQTVKDTLAEQLAG